MKEKKDKVIHITHNDADGVGCGVVAAILLPQYNFVDNTYFCPIGTQNELLNKLLDEYDKENDVPEMIIISDISLDVETAMRVNKYYDDGDGTVVYGCDHHVSNTIEKDAPDCNWFEVCTSKFIDNRFEEPTEVLWSATLQLYLMLQEYEIKDESLQNIFINNRFKARKYFLTMIDMISRYDTWEWKNHPYDYAENDSDLASISYSEDIYSVVTKFMGPARAFHELYNHFYQYTRPTVDLPFNPTPIPDIFKTIYDIEKDNIQRYLTNAIKNVKVYTKDGYNIACFINEGKYSNELSNYIYNNYNVDYIEIYYPSSNTVGYRTKRDDIDLSELAKHNYAGQGGGHKTAAGTKSIPNIVYDGIMSNYFIKSFNIDLFFKIMN